MDNRKLDETGIHKVKIDYSYRQGNGFVHLQLTLPAVPSLPRILR